MLESALVSAYKKNMDFTNVEQRHKNWNIAVYQIKDVVEVVENENLETLEDAKEKNFAYEVGDKIFRSYS